MDAKTDLKPIEVEELEACPVDSVSAQGEWLPSDDSPCNPRNWPEWKKNAQIVLASMHSMVAAFQAAGIIPSYSVLSKVYDCSLQDASYFVSTQVGLLLLHFSAASDPRILVDSHARCFASVLECVVR